MSAEICPHCGELIQMDLPRHIKTHHQSPSTLDQIAAILKDCDWSNVMYDDDALEQITAVIEQTGREIGKPEDPPEFNDEQYRCRNCEAVIFPDFRTWKHLYPYDEEYPEFCRSGDESKAAPIQETTTT